MNFWAESFDLGKFSDFVKKFRVNIFIILGLSALFRTKYIRVKSEGTIKGNILMKQRKFMYIIHILCLPIKINILESFFRNFSKSGHTWGTEQVGSIINITNISIDKRKNN